MVLNLSWLIKSCGTETHPAAETKSIGLPADVQLSWFLQSHLDSFIETRDSQLLTGIRPSGQLCLDQKTPSRLPGLCKNSCQRVPLAATQLNRRAVRCNAGVSESRNRGDFSGSSIQIKVDSVAAAPGRKERKRVKNAGDK
jgi:hypothetical protein